jgi:hypothetical protein
MIFLAGNAIVLERVPEDALSNVSAIRNMMTQMASVIAAALGLSVVRLGAPQAGGVKGVFDLPEHLLTSFHTILMVEFGGHLPTVPSF